MSTWVMPRSSSLGGVSQSPRPSRRWGSCSPFLKHDADADGSRIGATRQQMIPPPQGRPCPPLPGYSRAVGGDGRWRRRSPEGVVDGASSSP